MGKHKHKKHIERENDKKKRKKGKKHKKKYRSSSSSTDSDEWVEKGASTKQEKLNVNDSEHSSDRAQPFNKESKHVSPQRDEWMNISTKFSSSSSSDRRHEREQRRQLERQQEMYNPRTCSRELNPYWKDGGDGLPLFRKPTEENNESLSNDYKRQQPLSNDSTGQYPRAGKGWKKTISTDAEDNQYQCKDERSNQKLQNSKYEKPHELEEPKHATSIDLNMLASKLVKAEIMGNTELANQLREQMEMARKLRENKPNEAGEEEILLTHTDSKGYTRPIRGRVDESLPSGSRPKKQKVETHRDGQRVRYFADDDKYSLQQMFEAEKCVSIEDQNRDFLKMAGGIRKNDDLDEIFEDKIRFMSDKETHMANKAVGEYQKTSKSLDRCTKCIQSDNMVKHLMISMGETVYLSVPHHEPFTLGHCLLSPIRHVPCATQLDENEWRELLEFRKALTKMFMSNNETVIFFETAMNFNQLPHMSIECIPVPQEEGDLAPIYFKKAIDESEYEWSHNKKLVSLKGRNIQNTIPKGLPYFSVSFGMEEGFAHVIEEEKYFPRNFAQEILGGMLDLDHSKWRKPRGQNFSDQSKRVVEFTKLWTKYDITRNENT